MIISVSCRPVARQWDVSVPGTCIDTVPFYYGMLFIFSSIRCEDTNHAQTALAGTNLGFDIIIIILPLPVLWKLQLHRKEKLALTGIFALGFFVTIIQVGRIFSVQNLKTVTDSQGLISWSIIEVSLGVCCPSFTWPFLLLRSLD